MQSRSKHTPTLMIPGYKGIMDLDLTHIPSHLHHETIALHMKDIEAYKIEQAARPEHLRYDYVMPRVERIINNTIKMTHKIAENKENLWQYNYEHPIK